jgi:hypothetical protein
VGRWVRFARFVGFSAALSAGLCLVGWPLTNRWAGAPGIPAMILGCAVSLAAAAAAGLLVALRPGETPMDRMNRAMLAMLVRLGVVVVLGTLAVVDGAFATSPLLVWIAVAYAALLPLEVRFALV